MKMRFVLGFWVVVWMVCSSACSYINGFDSARKVADRFFEDRFENGGVGRDEYYSKVFWDNTDAARWQNIKKLVKLSLVELQSYSLVSWNLQDKLPTGQLSGTFVVLVFETVYEKGSGLEKLTLLKQSGFAEFEIVGHQIDSEQINEMVLKGIEKAAGQNA
jgi:hypothetical protein